MSENHCNKESELFSDLNITKSHKTYSRPKSLKSPAEEKTNMLLQKNFMRAVPVKPKSILSMPIREILNKEALGIFDSASSNSLKVNGFDSQFKKNSKLLREKASRSNGSLEFGKDWDEMEFLSSKTNHCTKSDDEISPTKVPKKVHNGEYARTRRNLVQEISSAKDSKKAKNIKEKSFPSSNSSEVFSISSIISNSPTKVSSMDKKSSAVKTHSLATEPKTLSLMDMVRKYSSNPNSISSSISNQTEKEHIEKEVSSANKNIISPGLSEVSCSSRKKLVSKQNSPMKAEKSPDSRLKRESGVNKSKTSLNSQKRKAPPKRQNGIKTPKPKTKRSYRKRKNSNKNIETEISISNVHSQRMKANKIEKVSGTNSNKRFSDTSDKASKKKKMIESSFVIGYNPDESFSSDTDEEVPLNSVNEAQTNPVELPKNLESESKKSTGDILTQNNSIVSFVPPIIPQNTNLTNAIPSTALLPSVPLSNTFASTYVTTDNNLIYSINPYVPPMPPCLPNSQSSIFVIPVPCHSCNNVPQQQNSNNSQALQPFYQVNCTRQDVESCVRNIVKSYYPQSNTNSNVITNDLFPTTSNTISNDLFPTNSNTISNNLFPTNSNTVTNDLFQVNSKTISSFNTLNISNKNISFSQSIPNSSIYDVLSSSFQNSSEPNQSVESDSDSETLGGLDAIERSASLLSHFNELMEKQTKLSLRQCKEKADEMFESHFSKELSVESFCMCPDVPEFFSSFCFKDSNGEQPKHKFDQDFKNASLIGVLKKYISEHIDKILSTLSPDPLLKLEQVLKGNNSNLSLAEKLLMKKILGAKKEISLRDLIGALFFVGVVTVFQEYKDNHQRQEHL